jgi:predicted acylesterase/phospholipase RssA
MQPPKLQFAFQGGGAKFIAMLPVAAAINEFARAGKITVSAVAGTSAGAICAALLAADCDFDALRTYLQRNGDSHLKDLVEDLPDLSPLSSVKRMDLRSFWRIRRPLLYIVPRVFKGYPILNEEAFVKFIDTIFSFCRKPPEQYDDISTFDSPKLFLTVTNIVNQIGRIVDRGDLKQSVIDSCSIPIVLRSFRYLNVSNFVDGGLSDNLPVGCLLQDQKTPVFAVFPIERQPDRPVREFFLTFCL